MTIALRKKGLIPCSYRASPGHENQFPTKAKQGPIHATALDL
ncbi:hypothetical protein [Polystyrenella longa]|nr:hypothetical protein [Polystyrenella longa]